MKRKLHLVLHVPKCAGRSIERHLERHLGEQRLWRPGKRKHVLPLEMLRRKYEAKPPVALDGIDAIGGHLFGQSIEALFPNREFVRSVILREPEKQILSWYNFRMMRYLSQGLHPFSFTLFVRSFPVDPVTHFLLERWLEMPWAKIASLTARQKAALLDASLSKFDRVVDISEADALCAWHCEDLGIPLTAERTNTSEQWASKTGWKPLTFNDLSDSERELLRRRFTVDRYLWRRWALKQDISFVPATTSVIPREPLRVVYELRLRSARQFGW